MTEPSWPFVGRLYAAPVGTALDSAGAWTDAGWTDVPATIDTVWASDGGGEHLLTALTGGTTITLRYSLRKVSARAFRLAFGVAHPGLAVMHRAYRRRARRRRR